MGQIPLAACIVRGRRDEGVTGQMRKARRWAGLWVSIDKLVRSDISHDCFVGHQLKTNFVRVVAREVDGIDVRPSITF